MRSRVYIDGFNLYYGALKANPALRWLDLEAWCARLLPGDTIDKITYCTAKVTANGRNPHIHTRQDAYLRALGTLPTVEIVLGIFKVNGTRMPRRPEKGCDCCDGRMAACRCCAGNTIPVIKTEEKGSDVNLAVSLLRDGYVGAYDRALVVSDDSDLQSAIDIVKNDLGRPVIVATPRNLRHMPLRGTEKRLVRPGVLAACQFPGVVIDGSGRAIHRPARWA